MPLASKSWLSAEIRDPHESSDVLSVCYVPDTLHVLFLIFTTSRVSINYYYPHGEVTVSQRLSHLPLVTRLLSGGAEDV